jgi:hypothetical protein
MFTGIPIYTYLIDSSAVADLDMLSFININTTHGKGTQVPSGPMNCGLAISAIDIARNTFRIIPFGICAPSVPDTTIAMVIQIANNDNAQMRIPSALEALLIQYNSILQ